MEAERTFTRLLAELALARLEADEAEQVKADAYDAWIKRFENEHADLVIDAQTTAAHRDEKEYEVRQAMLDYHEETGENPPITGLQVKRTKRVKYDDEDVIAYAARNGHLHMLQLQRFVVDKAARSGKYPDMPVTIEDRRTTAIPQDLTPYLLINEEE